MKKDPRRYVLSAALSFFALLFTGLSLWNSHLALHRTGFGVVGVQPSLRPGNQWTAAKYSNDVEHEDSGHGKSHALAQISQPGLPEPVCLEEECLVSIAQGIARAFPPRPHQSWCLPTDDNPRLTSNNDLNTSNHTWQGLLLVKVPKAASSTSAGLVLRVANRTGCAAVQWEHREGRHYAQRSPTSSFLVGSVRRPASRSLSAVWFFMIAPLNITPTDNNIIRSLHTHRGGKTKGKGGYQYNYLSLEPVVPRSVWSPHNPTQVINPVALYAKIQRLLRGYDFMMVVERMDESLTALALLTGLSLADVLVSNSKVTDGGYLFVRVGRHAGTCQRQLKATLSDGVRKYTASDEWLAMNYADEILYRAANASLDRTIARIGHDRFARALSTFHQLQAHVASVCGPRLGLGCTEVGQPVEEQCYLRDFGCGYTCVDSVVDDPRIRHLLLLDDTKTS